MISQLSKEQIINSLRNFRSRRDDLLHEDVRAFEHHMDRFVEFCRADPLVQRVLKPIIENTTVNTESWWEEVTSREGKVRFPSDLDKEFILRFRILETASETPRKILNFGISQDIHKTDDCIEFFRTIIVRSFADELTHRLGNAADIASPDERNLQAVPLKRIPNPNEIRIFLSHKSVDKPLVYRFYKSLKEIGFDPWLDEPKMAAGTNLERAIFQGFEESCAAVFFITENFKDEKYLAAEVDYAIRQKRKKDEKFAIITLRYSNAAPVPGLLTPFIYKDVANDLEAFYELIRALPVELGPVRWKEDVLE